VVRRKAVLSPARSPAPLSPAHRRPAAGGLRRAIAAAALAACRPQTSIAGDIKVAAFEPAAVNYYLLAANAEANQLDERIDAFPIGLGDRKAIARFDCTQFEPGKSFRVTTAEDEPPRAQQAVVVLTIDEMIEEYGVPCPNYIKIDAPRATRAIIDGGARTLGRPEVRELHVEVRETTLTGGRTIERLERHGFAITSRHEHGATDVIFSKPAA
jgi:FkbM family methyltransferase